MKEVFIHQDSARVGLCQSLLDEAGIASFVRNEATSNMIGVPDPIFYPILCVVNDADYDRAKAILDEYRAPAVSSGGEWICPHCQSVVPAGFDSCWNCERARSQS